MKKILVPYSIDELKDRKEKMMKEFLELREICAKQDENYRSVEKFRLHNLAKKIVPLKYYILKNGEVSEWFIKFHLYFLLTTKERRKLWYGRNI